MTKQNKFYIMFHVHLRKICIFDAVGWNVLYVRKIWCIVLFKPPVSLLIFLSRYSIYYWRWLLKSSMIIVLIYILGALGCCVHVFIIVIFSWYIGPFIIYLFIYLFRDRVSFCLLGWSAMVLSQLAATSTSWVPAILLPQPPK